MIEQNPMGREYTREEIAAGIRLKIMSRENRYGTEGPVMMGQMIYATGPYWPQEMRKRADRARKMAADCDLVADAMDREWVKPVPPPKAEPVPERKPKEDCHECYCHQTPPCGPCESCLHMAGDIDCENDCSTCEVDHSDEY